jgi:hypothetical protein
MFKPEEKHLANEIATALNDREGLGLYLKYAKEFKEAYLRKILARVLSIPQEKIKKSRGALFTYLIEQANSESDMQHNEETDIRR